MIRRAPQPEGDQEDGRSTGKGNSSRASVPVASRPVKEGGDMVRAVMGAAHAVSSPYRHTMAHPRRCQMSVGPDQTSGPARSRRLHARQLPAQRTRVGRPTPGQPPGATRRPRPPLASAADADTSLLTLPLTEIEPWRSMCYAWRSGARPAARGRARDRPRRGHRGRPDPTIHHPATDHQPRRVGSHAGDTMTEERSVRPIPARGQRS